MLARANQAERAGGEPLMQKKVFCENMTCKLSLLLGDLAILYYRTEG